MESKFIVECKNCGYKDELKNFNMNTCDICGEIECPKCNSKEEF